MKIFCDGREPRADVPHHFFFDYRGSTEAIGLFANVSGGQMAKKQVKAATVAVETARNAIKKNGDNKSARRVHRRMPRRADRPNPLSHRRREVAVAHNCRSICGMDMPEHTDEAYYTAQVRACEQVASSGWAMIQSARAIITVGGPRLKPDELARNRPTLHREIRSHPQSGPSRRRDQALQANDAAVCMRRQVRVVGLSRPTVAVCHPASP